MAFFIVAFLVVGFAVGLATKEGNKSNAYAIYFLISIAWAFAWGPFAILTFLELAGGDYLARKLKTPFTKKPIDDLQAKEILTTSSKVQTTKPSKSSNVTTKQNKLPKLTKESIAKNTKLKVNIVRNTSEITSSLPIMSDFPHIENAFTNMAFLSDAVIASLDLSTAILSLDIPNIELKDALNPNELLDEINRTFGEFDKVIADLVTTPLDYLKDDLSNKEKAELKRITKGKSYREIVSLTLDRHGISIEAELSDKRGEIVADAEDSLNAIAHILKEANEINRRLGNDPIKYEIVMLEAKLSQLKDSVHKYIRPVTAKSILEKAAKTINTDSSALKEHKVEPSTKPDKIKHEQSTTQPNTLQIGNSVRDPQKLIDNFSGTLKHIIIENNVISETLSVPKSILSITLISSVISQIESATPIGQLTIRQYRYSKTRMVANCSNLVIENTLSEIDISGLVSMATTSIHIANSEVKNESDALNGSNLRTISLAHIENAQEIRLLDNGNRSLQKITIRSCPNLKTVFSPLTSLNNLETIDVIASPNFVLPSDITRAKNLIRAPQTMNNCESFPTAPTVFIAVFDNYRSASLSAKEHALKGKSVKVKKYGRFTVLTGGTTALTLTESQVETLFMLREQNMTLEEVADVKCISSSTALNHAADMIANNYLKLDDIYYNTQLTPHDQKLIYAHFLEQASKNQTLRTKEVMEQYEHQIEGLTYTDLYLMKSETIRVNDYLQRTNNI